MQPFLRSTAFTVVMGNRALGVQGGVAQPGVAIKLLPGGDHTLSDYDQHLDAVLGFLGIPAA